MLQRGTELVSARPVLPEEEFLRANPSRGWLSNHFYIIYFAAANLQAFPTSRKRVPAEVTPHQTTRSPWVGATPASRTCEAQPIGEMLLIAP